MNELIRNTAQRRRVDVTREIALLQPVDQGPVSTVRISWCTSLEPDCFMVCQVRDLVLVLLISQQTKHRCTVTTSAVIGSMIFAVEEECSRQLQMLLHFSQVML